MHEVADRARAYKAKDVLALIETAKRHLATAPVFRSKPVGAPYSAARADQDDKIATEDALRAAIRALEP